MPRTLRAVGAVVILEGGAVVVLMTIVGVQNLLDGRGVSGGAAWFGLLGGIVLAAGIGLFRGKRWGLWRAIAVLVQFPPLLLGLLAIGDPEQRMVGCAITAVAAAALVLLFLPSSTRWLGTFRF